jgi:hypothetical protein
LVAGDRLTGYARDVLFTLNPFASAIQTLTSGYFVKAGNLWRAHLAWSLGLSAVACLGAYVRVRRLLGAER